MENLSSQPQWLHWDPPREIFNIPYVNHPITWYGVLFALGFFLGAFVVRYLAKRHFLLYSRDSTEEDAKKRAAFLTDTIIWFLVIGVVVGARLGHVLFYGWPYFKSHPIEILKVWEGGLASHGGVIGIIFSVMIYSFWIRKKIPEISFFLLIDVLAIPAALVGGFIRIGNFINQEIIGTVSFAPWAVVFESPLNGAPSLPRHPVQLYEAAFYLIIFVLLFFLWVKKERTLREGVISGLFLFLVFTFRFFIEFYKVPQSLFFNSNSTGLLMGQYLSVPFIIIGILFMLWSKPKIFEAKY